MLKSEFDKIFQKQTQTNTPYVRNIRQGHNKQDWSLTNKYICLMTLLLSRVVAKNYAYTSLMGISKEMWDLGFSVDLSLIYIRVVGPPRTHITSIQTKILR